VGSNHRSPVPQTDGFVGFAPFQLMTPASLDAVRVVALVAHIHAERYLVSDVFGEEQGYASGTLTVTVTTWSRAAFPRKSKPVPAC
jgi:hypothetical protein